MNGVQALSAINNRPTAVVIADQLRESIINGAFTSGDQINEARVATQLNVSRGPVREALHRLVQEGLLISRPNRGVFVREITEHDIAEVYEAREVIECAAAEIITKRADDARATVADELETYLSGMQHAIAANDWTGLSRIDLDFHTKLVEAGGNTRLLRAYQTLATEALICMNHLSDSYPQPDRVIPGHEEIIANLRSGDMTAVHLTLHQHLTLDSYELHTHDDDGSLRHGRNEEDVHAGV